MQRRILLTIVLFVFFALSLKANEINSKNQFYNEAVKLDSTAAAKLMSNLTEADYFETDTDMLLDAFKATLEARERFSWVQDYSDEDYYRYILPLRVDDEPLQPYRRYFLEEIGPRLDSLNSITKAALEVNLWLGERVGFKPTDWRDQGPLTSISCGYGRCGELMIMTIDAMRSVGIAARGVYVPFWSSCDNNHAWVEVLTEDGWKYLGASEPATRLNEAWFDRSVLRAPILLTKNSDFCADNKDAVKSRSGWTLNVTRNYIPPAKLMVNLPLDWCENDRVWFSLFNFGTVRPLVELTVNDFKANMEVGHGDFILMGVYKDQLFMQPFTAQTDREVNLDLAVNNNLPMNFTLRYPEPPINKNDAVEAFPAWRTKMAAEMRHRRDAERDWSSEWLDSFTNELGGYKSRLFDILKNAHGNESSIMNAVLSLPESERERAVDTIELLSAKDLRDVSITTLLAWFERNKNLEIDDPELKPFILNPKVAYEYPSQAYPLEKLVKAIKYKSLKKLRKDVERFSDQINSELSQRPLPAITIDNMLASGLEISGRSAAIWWVDRLRSVGIPAKKTPWSDWLEFYWEGEWLPLYPGDPDNLGDRSAMPEIEAHYGIPAKVTVAWLEGGSAPVFESEMHFLPINDKGIPDYRADYPSSIIEDSVSTILELVPGKYFFSAGRRNSRGDVAVKTNTIELVAGQDTTIIIDLVPPSEPPSVSGYDVCLSDLLWKPENSAVGALLIILGDNEPSIRTHDQALSLVDDNLSVTVIDDTNEMNNNDLNKLGLVDINMKNAPFVFYFDKDGRLLFTQSGYDLNLPSKLRNTRRTD